MAKITVHAGDFEKGTAKLENSKLTAKCSKTFRDESISINELKYIEVASEETVKKFWGAVGWGALGAIIAGPFAMVAGALLGGKKKEVTFIAEFKDGRRMLATVDNKTFIELKSAVF